MGKLWRIWKGSIKIALNNELAYRFNFVMKAIGSIIFNITAPIITLLIYTTSSGIPGWKFEEFLLMTGTFLLAQHLSWTLFGGIPFRVIERVSGGGYDVDLVRPISPLLLATITAFSFENLPGASLGLIVVLYSLIKMNFIFNIINILSYIFLLGLSLMFFVSLDIIVAALAFLATKTYAALNVLDELLGLGKNPLPIFGPWGSLILTFIFPVGITAFYPASALLGKLSGLIILELTVVTFTFFGLALLLWHFAIRKYTSAGG